MEKDYATLMAETICKVNWLVENAEWQNKILANIESISVKQCKAISLLLENAKNDSDDNGNDGQKDDDPVLP